MSEKPSLASRLLPLSLAALVIILDQWTKALIMAAVPIGAQAWWTWGGDFFELTHQRNTGVAFSMGNGLPEPIRSIAFVLLPLAALAFLAVYAWRDRTLTWLQRWGLGFILGGGLGNLIDRVFPPGGVKGVVDFLSFRPFGFLGWDRFATFNVADSAVSVGGALIVLSLLLGWRRK